MSKKKPLKILTTPMDESGCTWHRQKVWVAEAIRRGVDIRSITKDFSEREILDGVRNCDVLFVRFINEQILNMIEIAHRDNPSVKVVIDTDDDLGNVSPWNRAYETYGTTEIKLSDGSYLWKHMDKVVSPKFDKYRNQITVLKYEGALEQSDAVTVTTARLKESIDKWNDRVVIFPNSLNLEMWTIHPRPTDRINLAWMGGFSHYEDLFEIKDALKVIMDKYPQVHMTFMGWKPDSIFNSLPQDRVHFRNWIGADGQPYSMSTVLGHIGLCPLRDTVFNSMKSCLKWYEYSASGMATIAADVAPYSDEIQNGVNGLLVKSAKNADGTLNEAKTTDAWVKAISRLIDDPIERSQLATSALAWVTKNRDIQKNGLQWVEFLYALAGREVPEEVRVK